MSIFNKEAIHLLYKTKSLAKVSLVTVTVLHLLETPLLLNLLYVWNITTYQSPEFLLFILISYQASIYLFTVNNGNTRVMC